MGSLIKYIYILDEIRVEQSISKSDFCDGVCTDRQYRRYISGEIEVPQKNINLFCEKLGIRVIDFYYKAHGSDYTKTNELYELYRLFEQYDYEGIKKTIAELSTHTFYETMDKRLYDYCVVRYSHINKSINSFLALEQYSKIINYPDCLSRKNFDFVDLVSIREISDLETEVNKDTALNFLFRLLKEKNWVYLSGLNRSFLPIIYSQTAGLLVDKENYEDAYDIASEGVKYSLKVSLLSSLPSLYYFKAYSLHKLGKTEEAKEDMIKSFSASLANDIKPHIAEYDRIFKERFDIDIYSLFVREKPSD